MKSFSIALLLLSGAVSAQTIMTLPLEVINTGRPRHYIQVGTSQSTDLSKFRGVPTNLSEKVLRTANTIRGQVAYESFLRGETDRATWDQTKQKLGRDTLQLSTKPLRHQINTLVGTNPAGQRVVIVDANNNRDFSDDQVFTYPMTLPQIPKTTAGLYDTSIHAVFDTLPAVSVVVDNVDGQKTIQRTVSIKPIPYNDGWTYPNPEENRFHLTLLAHEYRQANLSILGRPVKVIVTTVPGLPYNTRGATIEIRDTGQSVNKLISQGNIQSDYTFMLADHVLEIKGLSMQGDQLTIVDKGIITPTR